MAEIDTILDHAAQLGASDLHLRVGQQPRCRVNGALDIVSGGDLISAEVMERLATEILSEEQEMQYRGSHEVDFSYSTAGGNRFRCNYFQDHAGLAAVFRRIAPDVPTLKELNLPREVEAFAHLKRGLVLVTGSSGSGKSSTLAALIRVINERYRRHIITLEDPIEYVHECKASLVHQRGMHYDITDFRTGILAATREDPDVLLIGELRDLESIRLGLNAAELGALVFTTLHTNGAADAVDRVIDVFPAEEQSHVRTVLSQCLAGIVSQALIASPDGTARYPATEILRVTPAVANLIRENKIQDIVNQMQAGRKDGMHTLEDSLEALVSAGKVSAEDAYLHARNKARFEPRVSDPDKVTVRRS